MKGNCYFEEEPWDKACERISNGNIGNVVAISVQCVCEKGSLDKTLTKWEERINKLLGIQISRDLIKDKNIVSMISKYENNEVVRIFIDDTYEEIVENFEIVSKNGLILWKPDVHLQGRVLSDSGFYCDCSQLYSVNLGGDVIC